MKPVTDMIATDGKDFFMKEAYCPWCGYKKVVALMEKDTRCKDCDFKPRRRCNFRWIYIGSKLDYSEYFTDKTARHMKQGRND